MTEADARTDSARVVIELRQTCLACPEQWEGTLDDGRVVYVRYRHGRLTLGLGATLHDAVVAGRENQLYYDPRDDWLGAEKMLELTGLHLAPGVSIHVPDWARATLIDDGSRCERCGRLIYNTVSQVFWTRGKCDVPSCRGWLHWLG